MIMFKWHTGGAKPCFACTRWNRQIFPNLDAVPELPVHPHCECFIEAIIDPKLAKELEEIGQKIQSGREQTTKDVSDLEWYAQIPYLFERITSAVKSLLSDFYQISKTFEIFWQNYQDMKKANTIGGDKYFHSKANAEAAQLGETGEATAKFISDFREFYEYYTNQYWKKMSLQATIKDMMEDQSANHYGRKRGREFPKAAPGDLVDILRPRGLDDKY